MKMRILTVKILRKLMKRKRKRERALQVSTRGMVIGEWSIVLSDRIRDFVNPHHYRKNKLCEE